MRQHVIAKLHGRFFLEFQPLPCAAGGVDQDAKPQRQIRRRAEVLNLLRHSIFKNLKIVLLDVQHQVFVVVKHGERNLHLPHFHPEPLFGLGFLRVDLAAGRCARTLRFARPRSRQQQQHHQQQDADPSVCFFALRQEICFFSVLHYFLLARTRLALLSV